MRDIILFGTGELLTFYEKLVSELGYNIIGYSDNNSSKWGTIINGKPVFSPNDLIKYNSKLFISTSLEKEISEQLKELNLENRLIYHKELEDEWIEKNINKWEYLARINIKKNDKRTIFFDLLSGTGWAGTETWSFKLASGLKDKGEEVTLLRRGTHPRLDNDIEDISKRINYSKLEYFETVDEVVKCLVNALPCVVINNFTDCALVAATIVKKYFPDMIKIIAISHGDNKEDIFKIASRENIFNRIICVSTRIKNKYNIQYNISRDKLLYKETPVDINENYQKNRNASDILRIAYPSRLVVKYKRTDLIEKIIELLEKEEINYIFNIAGEGNYEENLKKFIEYKKLNDKVKLHGLLDKDEMETFWGNQDIYINVSDSEGACQAMLEAMAHCVVPVVTDVSGVDDFIENRVNGFVSRVGDILDIASNIKWIYENKNQLEFIGKKAREKIISRCKIEDYIEFFYKNVLEL